MPLYDFRCDDCGVFDQWRTINQLNEPVTCPTCQKTAKRIFSPPMLLSSSLRSKQEIKEPQLVKRQKEPTNPQVKNHSGGRPWMIGH